MYSLSKEKVIFSVDGCHDVADTYRFTKYIAGVRALGDLKGNVRQCIGQWDGKLELSWIMDRDDFDKHVRNTHFVEDQEFFLHVPGNPADNCWLSDKQGGVTELGVLEEVSTDYLDNYAGWTYMMDTNKYYTCD